MAYFDLSGSKERTWTLLAILVGVSLWQYPWPEPEPRCLSVQIIGDREWKNSLDWFLNHDLPKAVASIHARRIPSSKDELETDPRVDLWMFWDELPVVRRQGILQELGYPATTPKDQLLHGPHPACFAKQGLKLEGGFSFLRFE